MVTSELQTPLDLSPIVVSGIVVNGRRLAASEPLQYEVGYEPDDEQPLYTLTGEFEIILGAPTRTELEALLEDELAFLWAEYAEADAAALSPGAVRLADTLRSRFTGSTDAAQVA